MQKLNKGNLLVVLILVGIFATGVTFGSVLTALTRKEPQVVITKCEAAPAEPAEPTQAEPAEAAIEPTDLGEFKLTAYCTCEKCCGAWADGLTYTGTKATAGRTVAVDPDVIPLGSKVLIDGHEYIAEDIGGAIQGNRIDVLLPTHEAAIEFGIKYADISILK